jgi:hypothetical protein
MSTPRTEPSSYWRRFIAEVPSMTRDEWLAKWSEGYTLTAWRRSSGLLGHILSLVDVSLELVATKPSVLRWWISREGRVARRVLHAQGRRVNPSALNAVHALRSATRYLVKPDSTVCVIGDGLGFLSACLARHPMIGRVVVVNLEAMLSFDRWGCELAARAPTLDGPARVTFLSHFQENELREIAIDMYFNISSFQEMTKTAIETYFGIIKSQRAILYCMNRVEKTLAEEGPIRFDEYPWGGANILAEGAANWRRLRLHRTRPIFRQSEDHQFAVVDFAVDSAQS